MHICTQVTVVIDSGGVWRFGQPGVMEGGQFFLTDVMQFAQQLLAAKNHVTPLETFQDQVQVSLHCTRMIVHVITSGYVTVLVYVTEVGGLGDGVRNGGRGN